MYERQAESPMNNVKLPQTLWPDQDFMFRILNK